MVQNDRPEGDTAKLGVMGANVEVVHKVLDEGQHSPQPASALDAAGRVQDQGNVGLLTGCRIIGKPRYHDHLLKDGILNANLLLDLFTRMFVDEV